MSFFEEVDRHIDNMLSEGVLPDSEEIIEMEVGPVMHDGQVPGQQLPPQRSGPEGGPISKPAANFPWMGNNRAAELFRGACMGRDYTAPPFSNQNVAYPPPMFGGASTGGLGEGDIDTEKVVDAVIADLKALQDSDE